MSGLADPAVVLVTGASGGLGGALARQYAKPGRTLLLHGREAARLAPVVAACEALGARVVPVLFDLADAARARATLAAAVADTPVDLAIVNAGLASTRRAPGAGENLEDALRVIDVNVRGAMATVDAVLPAMLARGRGQVALVSSLSAYFGLPVSPAYCASKAALKAWGEALRGAAGPRGVSVCVVLPGFVRTPMSERFPAGTPFLVEADDAARRIRKGLARDRARIAFPLPLALACRLLAVLPASWSVRLARRAGY